nr:hypothetical protein BaRGS_020216 [Batillaria attramentaria]
MFVLNSANIFGIPGSVATSVRRLLQNQNNDHNDDSCDKDSNNPSNNGSGVVASLKQANTKRARTIDLDLEDEIAPSLIIGRYPPGLM